MKNTILNQFEFSALAYILQGDFEVLELLRYQATKIVSIKRWYSGVGFAHSFVLDKAGLINTSSIRGVKDNFEITDVKAYLNNGSYNVGVYLFVRDGYIDWLEGVNYCTDDWPDAIHDYRFQYSSKDGKRDWGWLVKTWEK